jgi:hypothetical protein
MSFSPELLYDGITNLELRLKGTVLVGDSFSEYGEPNDARLELQVRYFFSSCWQIFTQQRIQLYNSQTLLR